MSRIYLIVTCSCLLLIACSPRDLLNRNDAATAVVAVQNIPELTPIPIPCQSDLQPEPGDELPYRPVLSGVAGCVTDEQGRPVANAGIVVASTPPGVGILDIGHRAGEDGRYWNNTIGEPGRYELGVYADGYRPAKKWVEVRKGQTAALDFVLDRLPAATATAIAVLPTVPAPTPYPFRCQSETRGPREPGSDATYTSSAEVVYGQITEVMGCITDPSGEGIAGATTSATPLDPRLPTSNHRHHTGKDGRYWEPNVTALGWWEITASAPGYRAATKRVQVRNNETAVLDFVLGK